MLIKDCRIVRSSGIVEGDILIEGEKISEIGRNLRHSGETINARGSPVLAGIVDAHVHMRDFEEKSKEDFTSGSMAALAGGVTTFLEMPNTSPEVVDKQTLKKRIAKGEKKSLVDFGIHLGFSKRIDEFKGVQSPSMKIYMERLGEDLEESLKKAFLSEHLLTLHAEDPRILNRNLEFVKDEADFLLHGEIREAEAEINAVKLASSLSRIHKKRVYICHVTLPGSVELLNKGSSCEVTPHHLLLTEKDLRRFGGFAKTNPPLRSKLDVYGLWQKVKDGRVQVIASDHAPHRLDDKEVDKVMDCPSGIPNLDVMLRLMLDLVNRGSLRLSDLSRMMCENPAKIFNVKNKGFLEPGADADLVILDIRGESVIDPEKFYSKAKYSPFEGRKTLGKVKSVFMRGKKAFEDGEFFLEPGYGRYLYRQI